MDLKQKLELAGAAFALVGVLGAGRAWLNEHDARNQAEATQKAQEQISKQAADQVAAQQRTIEDLQRQVVQIQQQQAQQLASIASVFAAAKTPQQIADTASKVIQLPVPATTTPQGIEIPTASIPNFKDYLQTCEECKAKLTAATSTADTDSRIIEAQKAQLDAEKQIASSIAVERDTWKKAAKGTFWGNTWKAIKHGLIGGGIGVAIVCGTGHCH
jgi:hypothetical protein